MKAVDIASPVAANEATTAPAGLPPTYQAPKYPYGTELHLDHETLAQIEAGNGKLPDVGKEINMVAKGKVTGHTVEERQDGSKRAHATVQLTALGHDGNDSEAKAAKGLYPSASGE